MLPINILPFLTSVANEKRDIPMAWVLAAAELSLHCGLHATLKAYFLLRRFYPYVAMKQRERRVISMIQNSRIFLERFIDIKVSLVLIHHWIFVAIGHQ